MRENSRRLLIVIAVVEVLTPSSRAAVVATSILDMSAEEAGRVLGMTWDHTHRKI
ncbi:MAG: hypothetical protein ACAH81_10205 [Actinomycetota bacterium]